MPTLPSNARTKPYNPPCAWTHGGEFLLREFAIFFYIANSCNIILRTKFIARFRNCSYSRSVLNRGPTLLKIMVYTWLYHVLHVFALGLWNLYENLNSLF